VGGTLYCVALALGASGVPQHRWSALVGHNWTAPGRGDLHLYGPDYDLVLHDVRARDEPRLESELDAMQWVLRLEYFLDERTSLTLGLDHMKWVMRSQTVEISGASASATYRRQPLHVGRDGDLVGHLHHSDGLNLVALGVRHSVPVLGSEPIALSAVVGLSAGTLVLNTDAELFGRANDKQYHLGGIGGLAVVGLRLDLGRFFAAGDLEGGRFWVADALTLPEGRVEHSWWLVGGVAGAGVRF
jgi:hypothetical protein